MNDTPDCFRCHEPVLTGGEWTTYFDGKVGRLVALHRECATRSLIGGLNHLMGRCTCCGGTAPPDPPEMTKREAAIAAVNYWKIHG